MRTDEQPGADLRIRKAVTCEPRDLSLLGGELVVAFDAGLDAALADMLTRRQELALGAPGERLGAHACEHLERGAQLLAGVDAAALTSQPFPVEEVSPGELEPDKGAGEMRDRLAVQTVGDIALAEQRTHARFDSERPLRADHAGALGQPFPSRLEQRPVTHPRSRFGKLGHHESSLSD